MNIQLDDEEENSSKTAEYFLPAGLTDEDTESESEASGGRLSVERPLQSRFEKQIPRNENTPNGTSYNGKSELPREELSPGNSYSSSVGRTVVNTPVTGGLFHRTLSGYQSEALNPPLTSLENEWRHSFSSNPGSPPYSAGGQYFPPTSEVFSTTNSSVGTGSVQTGVGVPNQSSNSAFYGQNTLTESQFSSVPIHQPYVNSFIPSSYSPQVGIQPSGSVIGSAFLIPDDSSTSSFTSYVDASVFPFTGERELSSSHHSSSWSRRSTTMKKMCRYFPNCPHGDSCKFYHPPGVNPAFAMTAEANLSHPGRPRTGSWSGLWSSNAAMEWMHAVIQRHSFFGFAHRNKHSSNAVVTRTPIVDGDRIEDTSKEHRSTIGSIFHPGFIVGNRHRNVAKNETSSKNAEKQMKKNARKSKKDKASSSSHGKENSSASQPNSLNSNQSLSSSGKQTYPSGNALSDNSNNMSTSSAALGSSTVDENDQPRKLTRAEKRRLRAIRFYENKRRVAEEAKQKQKMIEEQAGADVERNDDFKLSQQDKHAETISPREETEKLCLEQETCRGTMDISENLDRNVANGDILPSQEEVSNVQSRVEEDESDVFYDAPSADTTLLQSFLNNEDDILRIEEGPNVEEEGPKLDIAFHDEETGIVSVPKKNENDQNDLVFLGSELSGRAEQREAFASEELPKTSHNDSCKEQVDYWGSFLIEGDLHRRTYNSAVHNFIWNLFPFSCRFEDFSSLLCFFILYMFPIFSTLFSYLVPRPLSVNSLWFLLLMTHFWSWQQADNRWKRIFSRIFIPLYFLVFGFSHLTVIDQLTSMGRILLAYLLCIIRSGDILTREVLLVLCIQYIFLELIQSQPLWLQLIHFLGAIGYVNHLHKLSRLSPKWKHKNFS